MSLSVLEMFWIDLEVEEYLLRDNRFAVSYYRVFNNGVMCFFFFCLLAIVNHKNVGGFKIKHVSTSLHMIYVQVK